MAKRHKTSVHLDEQTHSNLHSLMDQTGVSMQDVIRSSIRQAFQREIENRVVTEKQASEIGTDILVAQIAKRVSEELDKRLPLIEAAGAKRKKDSEAA